MSHLIIYHLSDWHIAYNNDVTYRLESHEAHNTAFNNIKSHIHNHNITNAIIVITGDIFTFKTELRGYDVEDFYKFIKLYSSIAPIFCIPGLCDGNIEREIDLLKPLIENVKDTKYPIYYLNSNTPQYFTLYNKKICMCGINILNNNTGKYSLYDIFINDHCLDLSARNYDMSICLVHGNITSEELKSTIDISTDFTDMFDIVCAGSIHNYKTINNCIYCGSLFQQNRKESFTKGVGVYTVNLLKSSERHIVIHNIKTEEQLLNSQDKYSILHIDTLLNKNVFIERYLLLVHNNYGHITEIHKDNRLIYQSGLNVTKPRSVRIDYENCDKIYINNTTINIKNNYPKIHVKINDKSETEKVLKEAAEKSVITKVENISNIISNYIISYISDVNLIKSVLELHDKITLEFIPEINMYKSRFNISQIRFSNITVYGNDNHVDFNKISLGSIIGITSKNGQGKSTFINVIIAALYNSIERGNLAQLTRTGASGYDISMDIFSQLDIGVTNKKININKDIIAEYNRDKSINDINTTNNTKLSKNTDQITHNKLSDDKSIIIDKNDTDITQIKEDNKIESPITTTKQFINEYQINRSRYSKNINDELIYNNALTIKGNENIKNIVDMIVGDYDICMYTCFAQQKTSYNFLTETNAHQKDILEKFFHLDIIKKLKKVVDDLHKEYNIKLKSLNKPSNDSVETIKKRIETHKQENIKLEKSITDAEIALDKLRSQKDELLSNRPIVNKDLLNKDYLAKLEKYIAKHDITHTSEEELWTQVSELQLQILPIDNFKTSLTNITESTIITSNITLNNNTNNPTTINLINNISPDDNVETSIERSTKIIDNIIYAINTDINNYNNLLMNANRIKSDIEIEINKSDSLILANKNNETLNSLNIEEIQSQYDNLIKSRPKAEISTTSIKDEITRITNLMRNVRGLCTEDYEPLFSTTCQCCVNNKKLFGYCNIDALKTQLLEIDKNNTKIRESNAERDVSIKKMDKLIRLKKELISTQATLENNKDKLAKQLNIIDKINNNISILNKLSVIYGSIKTVRTNVKVKKMMEQLDDIKKYEKYTNTILQVEKKISNLSTHITEWRANIFQYQRTQILDENLVERTRLYEICKEDIENEIKIYNAYRNCFNAKDGIQVKLLGLKLPILNETINCYLKSFDVDFQVSIKLDSKNDIEINLVKRGSIEPIKLTAGYQHDLINLLLRVALWKLYEGPLPNFFVFDETFSHADQINLFKTIDFLKSLKKSDYPPQFILINSHNSDTINNLDLTLNIEHDEVGRISRLNNVSNKPFIPNSTIDSLTPYGEFSPNYLEKIIKSAINNSNSFTKNITKKILTKSDKEKNNEDKMIEIINKKTVDLDEIEKKIKQQTTDISTNSTIYDEQLTSDNNYYSNILKINVVNGLTCIICTRTLANNSTLNSHLKTKTHMYKCEKYKKKNGL